MPKQLNWSGKRCYILQRFHCGTWCCIRSHCKILDILQKMFFCRQPSDAVLHCCLTARRSRSRSRGRSRAPFCGEFACSPFSPCMQLTNDKKLKWYSTAKTINVSGVCFFFLHKKPIRISYCWNSQQWLVGNTNVGDIFPVNTWLKLVQCATWKLYYIPIDPNKPFTDP